MEGPAKKPESLATSTRSIETNPLTHQEKILSALQHNLDDEALAVWMAMSPTGTPVDSFLRWVNEFNATDAEDRGKGKYDHGRTLDQNVDITEVIKTGSGFDLTVTLHKNGEITFATPLQD
tara:strand:- start:236551 stop:236913 length:363 start_codon:yes stop_codon:yes gene_type:complete